MADPRILNLAKILIRYSTRVQPGDRVAIRGFPLEPQAAPLVTEIYREVLRAGGYPHTLIDLPGLRTLRMREASDEQLRYISPFIRMVMEEFEVEIRLTSLSNTRSMSNVPPERLNIVRDAYKELVQTWFQRSAEGHLRWVATRFPTNALAQEAEMSLREFEDFFYSSCFADCEDPIGEWQAMRQEQERIAQLLEGKRHLELRGPDIDLRLSIEGRRFIPCAGESNMPDGEIFTGPVEDSADGWVRFSYPCIYQGYAVEGVELKFEAGKVVEARAQKNEAFLHQTLRADAGAAYLGELGIGTNPNIQTFTGVMLFDEKMAGTLHLALGAGYPESGSRNQSSIHWDMLVNMREGGEILADGERIYESGRFLAK